MYIYNITTNVEPIAHSAWLKWMKEIHIPKVLSTGKFLNAKLTRVLVEEEMGGATYSVQYTVKDKETLESYYAEDATALREEANTRFSGQLVSFRTELEVIDEYIVQRAAATHYLFTYGTLQEKEVQLGVFARELKGFDDKLTHYRVSHMKVADIYPTLEHTGEEKDSITGKVYTLSNQELQKADAYEGDAYQRIEIELGSGKKAWTYIATTH